jgi:hypothetical protein
MAKLVPYTNDAGEVVGYEFYCPGCDERHLLNVRNGNPNGTGGQQPVWTFNGDTLKPTFRASVLVQTGCKTSAHKPGDACWCNYEARYGKPAPYKCVRCHLFVTDGKIQFLGDSSHELRDLTVELPDIPEEME